MTLRRTMLALGTVGMLAGPPLVAIAAPMSGGWHHHEEGMELLHGLNLSDAQKQQIHQIADAARSQMKASEQSLRDAHQQLANGLLAGQSLPQLLAIQRQEDMLREQMDAQRLAMAVQMRSVLTADQLAQASATHAKLVALHEQEHAVMGDGEQ